MKIFLLALPPLFKKEGQFGDLGSARSQIWKKGGDKAQLASTHDKARVLGGSDSGNCGSGGGDCSDGGEGSCDSQPQ